MSSLERMLSVLDAFSEQDPIWTVDQLIARLGYTKSTVYRYVKELCGSRLLAPVGRGSYMLGPRIIELDRQIRACDPLVTAGREVLAGLLPLCGEGVLMICSLYGDSVLCVQRAENPNELRVSYARGRPMPLFRGSASKVILAHLPERRLTRLFLNQRAEIEAAGLGGEWAAFRANLREIRRVPTLATHGEVDRNVFGISAPVFDTDGAVLASLTLAMPDRRMGAADIGDLAEVVGGGAGRLTKRIAALAGAVSEEQPDVAWRAARAHNRRLGSLRRR